MSRGKPFNFAMPVRNPDALRIGLRGRREPALVWIEDVDNNNTCDGWRPEAERFDDYEPCFDCWAYDPEDRLGIVHRPTTEWDDPSWVACEYDGDEFSRLRAADERNREEARGSRGSRVRSTRNHGLVYYAERDGLIKIGCSKQPTRRVASLRSKLLATEVGSYTVEHERHQQFAPDRVHGEWFFPSPTLLSHVASLIDGATSMAVAS